MINKTNTICPICKEKKELRYKVNLLDNEHNKDTEYTQNPQIYIDVCTIECRNICNITHKKKTKLKYALSKNNNKHIIKYKNELLEILHSNWNIIKK